MAISPHGGLACFFVKFRLDLLFGALIISVPPTLSLDSRAFDFLDCCLINYYHRSNNELFLLYFALRFCKWPNSSRSLSESEIVEENAYDLGTVPAMALLLSPWLITRHFTQNHSTLAITIYHPHYRLTTHHSLRSVIALQKVWADRALVFFLIFRKP